MIKPRASKSGLYASCSYSYWLDSLIQSGVIPKPSDIDDTSSSYADLGTLIHGKLQSKLGCVMQTTLEETLAPMRANASQLFKSEEDMDEAINANVVWASSIFPKALDGKAWVAEPEGEIDTLTGHLDFESQDQAEIIDLKTTSRKPDNARMKPLHLAQLVAYWELRGRKAKTARILYLDSIKGAWAVMTAPVDFSSPFVQEYAEKMSKHRSGLMALKQAPLMVPGDHCKSGFCSYRNSSLCYSSLIPPGEGSTIHENKDKAKKSEFAGPKTAAVKLW
jgi:PD-(D/E)XK nuclease superfamily